MSEDRLRPCPFCGGDDELALSEPPLPWFVICGACGVEGPYADKRKHAIAAWNTRAPLKIVPADPIVFEDDSAQKGDEE